MQYQFVANNPFAILTAIVAPAILTNACSVLALGTSNRLGRVVLLRALRLFYAALGLFASSALISVAGSMAAYYGQRPLFQLGALLAVLTGGSAVVGLSAGCFTMVNETRLAVKSLGEEARMRIRLHDTSKTD